MPLNYSCVEICSEKQLRNTNEKQVWRSRGPFWKVPGLNSHQTLCLDGTEFRFTAYLNRLLTEDLNNINLYLKCLVVHCLIGDLFECLFGTKLRPPKKRLEFCQPQKLIFDCERKFGNVIQNRNSISKFLWMKT